MNFRGGPSGLRKRAATVVDITALVDVVFQLLIFFLLTSTYITQEGQAPSPRVQVDLPESNRDADPNTIDDVTVTIDEAGAMTVGDEPVNLDQLSVLLQRAKNDKPNTIVLVRGDQNALFGRVAQVMELARVAQLQVSVVLGGP